MDDVLALFRSADALAAPAARARLATLGPGLTLGGSGSPAGNAGAALEPSAGSGASAEAAWLATEGFAALHDAATADTCTRLVESIERLIAAGLPAMFVYLFDEPWRLGEQLCAMRGQFDLLLSWGVLPRPRRAGDSRQGPRNID